MIKLFCVELWTCFYSKLPLSEFLLVRTQFSSVQSLSRVRLFVTLWTVARQAPLSMGFSRQEYCSGLPFPPPGYLPDLGIIKNFIIIKSNSLPHFRNKENRQIITQHRTDTISLPWIRSPISFTSYFLVLVNKFEIYGSKHKEVLWIIQWRYFTWIFNLWIQ